MLLFNTRVPKLIQHTTYTARRTKIVPYNGMTFDMSSAKYAIARANRRCGTGCGTNAMASRKVFARIRDRVTTHEIAALITRITVGTTIMRKSVFKPAESRAESILSDA